MHTSNLTSKGRVTVPARIRRELGLKPCDKIRFVRKGRKVLIEAVAEEPLGSLFGLLKAPAGRGIADIDAAIADRFAPSPTCRAIALSPGGD